ncbi:MAG: cytochrome c biogenesis protein CcsA [Candidatus Bathyarchaeia archaeon]
MELEIALLIVAVLFLVFDLFQLSRSKRKKNLTYGLYGAALGFGLVLIAYILLLQGFVTDNFSFTEVYTYSSSSLSLVSKVCASWAGAGGSILFLSVLIGAIYFAYRLRVGSHPSPMGIGASQVLNVFALFFVVMDIGKNPFTRLAAVPPDGAGLNPALQSPWMMVHPPIVFGSYAFVLLSFALVLGAMKAREASEDRLLKVSTGVAWLLLTIGIAMGGLWAYEVLGWGGYWSWDPVETGSLLVWLALTAYFFVRPISRNGKGLAREFMILVAFAALIFLSALTRGGLLRSVHAYAMSPAGPILLGLALGMGLYFFYLKRKLGKPLLSFSIDKSTVRSLSFALAFASLIALFMVSFFGVAFPILEQLVVADAWAPTNSFYNFASFPFAALFVLALVGIALGNRLNVKKFGILFAGAIFAGAVLSVLHWPTSDILANVGFPVLVVALVSVFFDLVASAFHGKRTLGLLGRQLLFLGVVIGLLGILFSSASKETVSFSSLQFQPDGSISVDTRDATIVFSNFTSYAGSGQVYSTQLDSVAPESSALRLDVNIQTGGAAYHDYAWAMLYTNYGPVTKPLILHSLQEDIYVHLDVTYDLYSSLMQALAGMGVASFPQALSVTVESVPMVSLLWAGVAIICVGMVLQVGTDLRRQSMETGEDL